MSWFWWAPQRTSYEHLCPNSWFFSYSTCPFLYDQMKQTFPGITVLVKEPLRSLRAFYWLNSPWNFGCTSLHPIWHSEIFGQKFATRLQRYVWRRGCLGNAIQGVTPRIAPRETLGNDSIQSRYDSPHCPLGELPSRVWKLGCSRFACSIGLALVRDYAQICMPNLSLECWNDEIV